MTFQRRHKALGPQIRIGLVFLILASLSKWFLVPGTTGISDTWTDGITGLLYGVCIGCLLLGIWRNSRRDSGTPS